MTVELSDEEMLRYNRQIVLRGFDFDGQERLKAARVLVVGPGGAGGRRVGRGEVAFVTSSGCEPPAWRWQREGKQHDAMDK
ncbi:HofP DNA utilization family protein, partial [Klebsiella pneumoniae]|nr:HofP DNA utilization family protein [Klebsiella pneumoniae]